MQCSPKLQVTMCWMCDAVCSNRRCSNNSSSNSSNLSKLNSNSSSPSSSSSSNSLLSNSRAASDCHRPMLATLYVQRFKKLQHPMAQVQLGKLHPGLLDAPSHPSSLVSLVLMTRRCVHGNCCSRPALWSAWSSAFVPLVCVPQMLLMANGGHTLTASQRQIGFQLKQNEDMLEHSLKFLPISEDSDCRQAYRPQNPVPELGQIFGQPSGMAWCVISALTVRLAPNSVKVVWSASSPALTFCSARLGMRRKHHSRGLGQTLLGFTKSSMPTHCFTFSITTKALTANTSQRRHLNGSHGSLTVSIHHPAMLLRGVRVVGVRECALVTTLAAGVFTRATTRGFSGMRNQGSPKRPSREAHMSTLTTRRAGVSGSRLISSLSTDFWKTNCQ